MKYSFEIGLTILLLGLLLYLYRTKTFLILPNLKYEKALRHEILIILVGWLFLFIGMIN